MKCDKYSKLMIDHLAGEASAVESAELMAHLDSCDECRREFEDYGKLWKMTVEAAAGDLTQKPWPEDRRKKLMEELEKEGSGKNKSDGTDRSDRSEGKKRKIAVSAGFLLRVAALLVICGMVWMISQPLSSSREKSLAVARVAEQRQAMRERAVGEMCESEKVSDKSDRTDRTDRSEPSSPRLRLPSGSERTDGNALTRHRRVENFFERRRKAKKSISPAKGLADDDAIGMIDDFGDGDSFAEEGVAFGGEIAESGFSETFDELDDGDAFVDEDCFCGDFDNSYEMEPREMMSLEVVGDVDKGFQDCEIEVADDSMEPRLLAAQSSFLKMPEMSLSKDGGKRKSRDLAKMRADLNDYESHKKEAEKELNQARRQLAAAPAEHVVGFAAEVAAAAPAPESEQLPMKSAEFALDLKLWNLTSIDEVRDFLRQHGVDTYRSRLLVTVDEDDNLITIRSTSAEALEKASEVFENLRREQEELRDSRSGLPMLKTVSRPVSTFSIDVDTASYTAARKRILAGRRPAPLSVRPEEFINYFDYHYPSPTGATFAVELEAAPSPFRPGKFVLDIGVQGRRLGPDADQPAVYTILVDNSGSMVARDRLFLAKYCLKKLLGQLKIQDRVSIITCGGEIETRALNLPGRLREKLRNRVQDIRPEGASEIGAGLLAAYDSALKTYLPGGFNRVVVFTDGIVKLKPADHAALKGKIEEAKKYGIANTMVGVGGVGDDQLLESVAADGDGNFIFIDSEIEADEVFINQFAAKFREIARNVKIQVEFEPAVVTEYRQVGYQNRQLSRRDFRDDKVDAGEVGAGQSVTALYEMKLADKAFANPDAVVARVWLRYQRVDTLEIEEREYELTVGDIFRRLADAPPSFKLAVTAAEFAESLRFPGVPGIATATGIGAIAKELATEVYPGDGKVIELRELIDLMK